MKIRTLIICAILLAICMALLLRKRHEPRQGDSIQTITVPANDVATNYPAMTRNPVQTKQTNGSYASPAFSNTVPATFTGSNAVAAQMLAAWQGSIEFYGKVVDENSNAVAGATASFHWVEIPTPEGNRATNIESDAEGLFSLHGQRGLSLGVSVSKDGYYASRKDNDTFVYGSLEGTPFSPDPENPVIFNLKKKGTPEALIHIAGIGLHTMRDFLLAADGKPTEVSLRDGRLTQAGQGDLKVEFQAGPPLDNFPSRISWQCQVSVPGGGLVQTSEEFPFLAPENGYQEFDQWNVGATNWTETLDKQYYLKLRDGNFGRVKLRVIGVPNRAYFRMESFLNPSGSRNLEPQ